MLETSKQDKLIARLFRDTLIIFLLSMFAEKAGSFIDGVLTGKFLGTEAIAAFGLTTPYQKFTLLFTCVMALGMQILCGKTLGAGKLREANGIFSLALTATVSVAILLLFGTLLFAGEIIDLLDAATKHELIRTAAVDYLQAYAFALPAIALMAIFTPIMQLDNDRRRAVLAVALMSVCNVTGDLINVFVLDGGLFGMGIATAVSYWIAAGFLYLHFRKPESNFSFTPAADLKSFREMVLIGSPEILINGTLIFRKDFFNRLALTLTGGAGLAAYTILVNFSEVLETLPQAAGASVQMIGGIFVGERDGNSIRKLINVALKFTLTVTPIIAIVSFAAAPLVAEIYTRNDPETFAQTVTALRFFALGLPFYTLYIVWRSFYQAYGRFRLAGFLSTWNIVIFSVPCAYLLSREFGMDGVWYTLTLNQIAILLVVFVVTCYHCGRITFKLDDYLLLPDDFDVSESSRLDITVTSKAEVVNLSERAQNFCMEHDIDKRRSMFAAICIEEMAGNIVDYGFGDGGKHFVDVRVIVKDSQVTIRLRDDCKPFNPKKWTEIYNPDDPTAHIGIRLVRNIATEFNYVNVLKLNNLIIKI